MIKENVSLVKRNIDSVCRKYSIDPQTVTIIGVTKYANLDSINEAIEAGLDNIAENKVQLACEKFPFVKEVGKKITKHMIGHLQTNKVKEAIDLFDLIQSVDSLKLVLEIEKQAEKSECDVNILIQVNAACEENKYGLMDHQVPSLMEKIKDLKRVHVCGFMTMAPFVEDQGIIRSCFRKLRLLRDQMVEHTKDVDHIDLKVLSMGMTNDYEIAIEEGSNMLRIGRAFFTP